MTEVALRALGLSVEFAGRRVLDGVSLEASAGTVTAVVGPNGAGKTTLLRALAGLLPEAAGDLILNGTDPRRSAPPALSALRAYGAQDPASAWDFTVNELGTLSPHPEAHAPWLRRLSLEELADRRLSQLSVGQRKAAFLALTLSALGDPFGKILLLDEPAAGLDRHRQEIIRVLVRELANDGAAVVVATHDLGFAGGCDQVAVLAEGRLVAQGAAAATLELSVTREALAGGPA